MSAKTLIVFFNLKSTTDETKYLEWAKKSDLPTVNKLSSVSSFEVFKGISMFAQDKPSPWDYFEVIHIDSEKAFLTDIQTEEMQKIVEQFQAFTEDVHFIVTQNIISA
ncbi:MAG: REDY-like protein HapK [Shewanella sp.]